MPTLWQGTNCRLLLLAGEDGVEAVRFSVIIIALAPPCYCVLDVQVYAWCLDKSMPVFAGGSRLMECHEGAKTAGPFRVRHHFRDDLKGLLLGAYPSKSAS